MCPSGACLGRAAQLRYLSRLPEEGRPILYPTGAWSWDSLLGALALGVLPAPHCCLRMPVVLEAVEIFPGNAGTVS